MKIPSDFFRDEVRCGFWIPTAIKQAWAAQLTILAEIDRICEKHGITYYAEWGTLLGAVRHGGFVPWDDDLDIGMKRGDYNRFRAVADAELPKGYVIHDYESQKDHWLFLARVVNHAHITFDAAELGKWHNYPWLAGIDIFIQDYCYRDQEEESQRRKEVLKLIALADAIVAGKLEARAVEAQMREIERKYPEGGILSAFSDWPDGALSSDTARKIGIELYRLAERQMARVPAEKADRLVQMFPWGLKGNPGLPKPCYDQMIRLPFEMTTIPVPADYAEMLRYRYSPSYLEIRKVWNGHAYPSFEGQRENLQKMADFSLPGFRWEPRMLQLCRTRTVGDGNAETSADERAAASPCPEAEKMRRKVLFLPVGIREWRGSMARLYEETAGDSEAEASVVPLPLLEKNAWGEVAATDEELMIADQFEAYPSDLPLIRWYDYDPAEHPMDRIVIQNPYDAENPCLTVPPAFYAENLRQYTKELIYLPSFRTDEFGDEDHNDLYNMKHYVTAPGVIYADKVLVQSENIRQQYVKKLTAFAGEDTRKIWERKIRAEGKYDEDMPIPPDGAAFFSGSDEEIQKMDGGHRKKRILFCLGLNETAEHEATMEDAVLDRLRLFGECEDDISWTVCLYPSDPAIWQKAGEKAARLMDFLNGSVGDHIEKGRFAAGETEVYVRRFDAYYGSPSPLVPVFTCAKKPVMIMDTGISASRLDQSVTEAER